MGKAEKISVELPARMADTVRAAVASGDYADAGEVVRDALRDWSAKRRVATAELEELRQLIREGDESGPGIDAELVFARLRAKYAAMAEG